MPEVPEQIQENLAHLELEATNPRVELESQQPTQNRAYHDPGTGNSTKFPPRGASLAAEQYNGHSGYGEHEYAPTVAPTDPHTAHIDAAQARGQDPYQYQGVASRDHDELDQPSFSPFPKLHNPPPNVPPSDEEKEAVL